MRFRRVTKKIHIDIDPSSINKNIRVDVPIIGDAGNVLGDLVRLWRSSGVVPDKKALAAWWEQIGTWRKKNSLAFRNSNEIIKPQYAIQRLYEPTKTATPISRPKSASIRCGPRSSITSRSRTAG